MLLVAFSTDVFAGKQQAEGKQISVNRGISKSSFLSHAQCMPNLEIPAASSYETTIEEENRWLKPFEKKKILSLTSFPKEKYVYLKRENLLQTIPNRYKNRQLASWT